MLQVVTIWGLWNTIGSYHLENSYVKDVISAHSGYLKLDKTSAWSTSQEASSAVAYLYGLLLIVQLDVVYPSRCDDGTATTLGLESILFSMLRGNLPACARIGFNLTGCV